MADNNRWQLLPLDPETNDWKRMGHPEKSPLDTHKFKVDDQELYACLRDLISAIEIRQQVASCEETTPGLFLFNFAGHIRDVNFYRASLQRILARYLDSNAELGPLLKLKRSNSPEHVRPWPVYNYRQYFPSLFLDWSPTFGLLECIKADCRHLIWFIEYSRRLENDVPLNAKSYGPVSRGQLCIRTSPTQVPQALRRVEGRLWRPDDWDPVAPAPPHFNFFCSYAGACERREVGSLVEDWAIFVQIYLQQVHVAITVALKQYPDGSWFLVTDLSVDTQRAKELTDQLKQELRRVRARQLPKGAASYTVILKK